METFWTQLATVSVLLGIVGYLVKRMVKGLEDRMAKIEQEQEKCRGAAALMPSKEECEARHAEVSNSFGRGEGVMNELSSAITNLTRTITEGFRRLDYPQLIMAKTLARICEKTEGMECDEIHRLEKTMEQRLMKP